ncbi:MAG TPA: TonB-dependent receptor [Bacteroidia bacterium]|nr:TonB-dependent receptor [Bacteroidia bacterium]
MKSGLFFMILMSMLFSSQNSSAQITTQNLRGVIRDKQSHSPIPGVTVMLLDSTKSIGTLTDVDGQFFIKALPIGRVSIKAILMGYSPVVIRNLILDAGKELVINFDMEEQVSNLKEVVISAGYDKRVALNEMSTVSARSFSVEETNRYAGSLSDPSRMAMNFAGVSVASDSRNDVVIRGNSPTGLLWRMDGVNIPNPNHFGTLGTTGGPVSMLNNNLLDNSDFMTGAFPAEYGNALSGAFDLKMRHGNNEKAEFVGQIGFNGFELGAEGPIGKKKKASYLANYRYSTLGLLNEIGIRFGYSSIPQYQDLSFKIDVPTGIKSGRFTLFGIGGKSYIELLDKDKKEGDFTVSGFAQDTYYRSNMGVVGLSHKLFFNENTSQTIYVAASGTQNIVSVDSLYNNKENKIQRYGNNSSEEKYSFSYNINKKFNSKNTISVGFISDIIHFNYADSVLNNSSYYRVLTDFSGTSALIQGYGSWQHRFSDKVTLNSGLHYQQFLFNNSYAIEPRIGLKWNFLPNQFLSVAAGMHSQIQTMRLYFYETELPDHTYIQTNKNMDMTQSNHYVIAYDNQLSENWRIKVEGYYQDINNVPVETAPSTYSTLNIGADYVSPNEDSLVNNGTGKNIGVEFTLEKFFSKNYYLLLTTSLFDSKYSGSDGVERNTAFNGNYTINLLSGVEFNLDSRKRKVLTLNGKYTLAGGKRYIPIDLEASIVSNETEYNYENAYENKYSDYSRLDVKFGFKLNGKKVTQEWTLDIQNILDSKNVFQQVYNPTTQSIQTEYQLGFFPMVTYRILF